MVRCALSVAVLVAVLTPAPGARGHPGRAPPVLRGGPGAPHRRLAAADPPDAPGRQRPRARGQARELRDRSRRSRRRATPGGRRRAIELAWEPVVSDAEYRSERGGAARAAGRGAAAGDRDARRRAHRRVALDPAAERGAASSTCFRVEAWKDGRLVGDLYTHDGGAHSWNYRFRVLRREPAALALPRRGPPRLVLAGAYAAVVGGGAGARRRRARVLAGRRAALARRRRGRRARPIRRGDLEHRARGGGARRVAARRQARLRELVAAFVVGGAAAGLVGSRRDTLQSPHPRRPARRLAGAPARRGWASSSSSKPPTRASSTTRTTLTSRPARSMLLHDGRARLSAAPRAGPVRLRALPRAPRAHRNDATPTESGTARCWQWALSTPARCARRLRDSSPAELAAARANRARSGLWPAAHSTLAPPLMGT